MGRFLTGSFESEYTATRSFKREQRLPKAERERDQLSNIVSHTLSIDDTVLEQAPCL